MSERERAPGFDGPIAARAQHAIEAMGTGDPRCLPAVIEAAARQTSVKHAVAVLDALVAEWRVDPRLTTLLGAWIRTPPWTGTASQKAWRRVFTLLERVPDVRLRALADVDLDATFPVTTAALVTERRARLLGRAFPEGASNAEREAWGAIGVAGHRSSGVDLVALGEAVLDAPHDDGLLRVWADALLEAGDLRGELVQLQLADAAGAGSREGTARQKVLLHDDVRQATWLGPVHEVLLRGGRVWERGLLVEAPVAPRNAATVAAALGASAWRTVRVMELRCPPAQGDRGIALVEQTQLDALDTVRGLLDGEELARVLASPAGARLTTLGLAAGWTAPDPEDWRAAPVRPGVRDLELTATWRDALPALGRVLPGLERVAFVAEASAWDSVRTISLAAASALLPVLRELAPDATVRVTRKGADLLVLRAHPDGRWEAVQLDPAPLSEAEARWVREALHVHRDRWTTVRTPADRP